MLSTRRLETQIKQTKPFASAREEAVLTILYTADTLRRRYGEVMAPFGVTFPQYNVLRIVRGAGEAGIPSQEICERMIERSPGMTRLLDRLEQKGLVTRTRSSKDRRIVFCSLTSQGSSLLTEMEPSVRDVEQQAMASLDEARLHALTDLATEVYSSLDRRGTP